uniref:Cytoadherence linked asexual protein 9 n=1 Tax=Strongyloides papillosus TaxID=174720 RepID=A0A0N5BSD4_STREA
MKFAVQNKITDKAFIEMFKMFEEIALLTKSLDLVMHLKNCQFLKYLNKKNESILDHEFNSSYIKPITLQKKILTNQVFFNRMYKMYFFDIKREIEEYVRWKNLSKYIYNNVCYLLLYIDDIKITNANSGRNKNGNITHIGYKLIPNTDQLETPNLLMSELHNYRTIGICHQRNSSLTNYSDVLKFTVDKINSLKLSIFPGIETDVKLHALIGDHAILQKAYNQKCNYRNQGSDAACRACTLPPNLYDTVYTCAEVRNYLRESFNHDYLPKNNHMYSDSFHDIFEVSSEQLILTKMFYIYLINLDYTQTSSIIVISLKYLVSSILNLAALMNDYSKSRSDILLEINNAVDSVLINIKTVLPKYEFSMKTHMISHYYDMIRLLGHPALLSCIRFEASNKNIKDYSKISKCRKTPLKTTLGKMFFFNQCQMLSCKSFVREGSNYNNITYTG